MRINKYVALACHISRRQADQLLAQGKVSLNGKIAVLGDKVDPKDQVQLNGENINLPTSQVTIIFNKPIGYVVSRNGQGSPTIYDLLPSKFRHLKAIGRLDKASSGLLILTDDGNLINHLSHPRYFKNKCYHVQINKPLTSNDEYLIREVGVQLDDGISRFSLKPSRNQYNWIVTMHEGRNRQIRRTFKALGYEVKKLHRFALADYQLNDLAFGKLKIINEKTVNYFKS